MVLVSMERESAKRHAAFCTRMRSAPEVQQCYVLAGEWDYLVLLATTGVAHCREVAERLFGGDEGTIRRYETRMVFEAVKTGLQVPTREPARRRGHPRSCSYHKRSLPGAARPKYSYARAVATRPRGVRSRKPC